MASSAVLAKFTVPYDIQREFWPGWEKDSSEERGVWVKIFGRGITKFSELRVGVSRNLRDWCYVESLLVRKKAWAHVKQWRGEDEEVWEDGIEAEDMGDDTMEVWAAQMHEGALQQGTRKGVTQGRQSTYKACASYITLAYSSGLDIAISRETKIRASLPSSSSSCSIVR